MGPCGLPPPLPLTSFLSLFSLPPPAESQPTEDYICGAGEEEEDDDDDEVSRGGLPASACPAEVGLVGALCCPPALPPSSPTPLEPAALPAAPL